MTGSVKSRATTASAAKAEVDASAVTTTSGVPCAPPLAPPPFSLADVRAAIPEHCFVRSAWTGLRHVAVDLLIIAALFTFAYNFIAGAPLWVQLLAWPAYWLVQGAVMTGVWVLAHECGHGGFSASSLVNDVVGWVLHSALLVPYFSWKYSHATHHRNTCSIENDEVFVPATRSDFVQEMISETPLVNAFQIFVMLTVGWPGYIIMNAAGPAKYRKQAHNSHFHPWSSLFTDNQRLWVAVSDVGFFGMVALLGWACYTVGAANVLFYYFMPYMVVNAFLVLITYLQHTDTYVPHYREKEFTWLRGALATVDRSYGWLGDAVLHHIADTHVVHHLFSHLPFYHAQEATAAVKRVLGPYYLSDPTPIPLALWKSWTTCKFVEDEGDIVFLKDTDAFNKGLKAKAA